MCDKGYNTNMCSNMVHNDRAMMQKPGNHMYRTEENNGSGASGNGYYEYPEWLGIRDEFEDEQELERKRTTERRQALRKSYIVAQLPQKRVSHMTVEERKAYNRQKVAERRAKMTPEKKEERKRREAERKRKLRSEESPDERALRQQKDREYKRKVRITMTPGEKEDKKKRDAERKQRLRSEETVEEKALRQQRDREYKKRSMCAEMPDEILASSISLEDL